ncbi:UPF0158 family protein [Marinimicrobium sp. C2-29]|uniref:UPF0158 family protein n=1 Tax=Marinimicrobium sp. C2-29 TaxID=3139825 RepID=UPI00313975CD
MKPVSLNAIVDALEFQSDDISAFLNLETGEVVTVTTQDEMIARDEAENGPEWMAEVAELLRDVQESGNYLQLPDAFEIHEYRLIEDFCFELEDPDVRETMLRAIKGSGAFRRFKDKAADFEIIESWHSYRTSRLESMAKDWCNANDIPWTR